MPLTDDLEALVSDGARLVQALRPVWREVSRAIPRGRGRTYLAFAAGMIGAAAVAILVSRVRRQRDDSGRTT